MVRCRYVYRPHIRSLAHLPRLSSDAQTTNAPKEQKDGTMADDTTTTNGATTTHMHRDDRYDRDILREVIDNGRENARYSAHNDEENREDFGATREQQLAIEGRSLVEAAKNGAVLGVQVERTANALGVQADRNAAQLSVQADRNASESRLQVELKTSAAALQAQTFAAAATLQATQIAAETARRAADCCCELKEKIRDSIDVTKDEGQRTRDLINAESKDRLRDENAALRARLNALFTRNVAPTEPVDA